MSAILISYNPLLTPYLFSPWLWECHFLNQTSDTSISNQIYVQLFCSNPQFLLHENHDTYLKVTMKFKECTVLSYSRHIISVSSLASTIHTVWLFPEKLLYNTMDSISLMWWLSSFIWSIFLTFLHCFLVPI